MAGRRYGGHKRQRGPDTWELRIYLGTRPGGKKYHTETFHGTARQAEERLNQLCVERRNGKLVDPSKMTVAEYLMKWLDHYAASVRPNTLETARCLVQTRIIPAIGALPLQKLTPLCLQDLYRDAAGYTLRVRRTGKTEYCATRTNQAASPSTIRRMHAVLYTALKQAVAWGLLADNPASRVMLPRAERKPVNALGPEEAKRFLEVARKNTRYYVALLTALASGLRWGELFGLTWADVNLTAGTLTVTSTLIKGGPNMERGDGAKTRHSARTIDIPADLCALLREHHKRQLEERLASGGKWHDRNLVFPTHYGTAPTEATVRKVVKRVAHLAGLPHLRIHDLRHSHATILLAAGVSLKTVSERLGHASVSITGDVYGHVTSRMRREAAEMAWVQLTGP